MKRHKTVNEYITSNKRWEEAVNKLRGIVLKTALEETVKWGASAENHS